MSAESVEATGRDIRLIAITALVGGVIANYLTTWIENPAYFFIGSVLLLIASSQLIPQSDTVEASHVDASRVKGWFIVAVGALFVKWGLGIGV